MQRTLATRAKWEAKRFDRAFWSGQPLDELFDKIGPEPKGRPERIFAAGMVEWDHSHRADGRLIAGVQSRIERSMNVAVIREAEALQSGLSVLATVVPLRLSSAFLAQFGVS